MSALEVAVTYADELVRVSLKWAPPPLAGWGGERAVTTWHLRHHHITGNGFTWADQMHHLPQQIADKLAAHWTAINGIHANNVQLVEVKTAHIDAAGRDLDVGAVAITDGSLGGNGGTSMAPPEVACCVSEWAYEPGTFAPRKGRRRGRFYLPYIASGWLSTQGRLKVDLMTDLVAGYQAFFNDIQGMHTFNEDTPPDPNPDYWDFVVASSRDATWENISWVSIDDALDSQRRRQRQGPTPTRVIQPISH